jgi:YHS domain-containing protein
MRTIDQFEQSVSQRFHAVNAGRQAAVEALSIEMAQREQAAATFAVVANQLHDEIIHPRMEAVTRQFPDAKIARTTTPFGLRAECQLLRSAQYPAHTKLALSITRSPEGTRGFINYSLEIIPILMAFHGECHLEFDPGAPDENEIAEWVEARLLDFVETYLRVGTDPQYQRNNHQIDPVCGMSVPVADVAEHLAVRGHTYHFCSAACRERFAAAPELYLDRPYRLEVSA